MRAVQVTAFNAPYELRTGVPVPTPTSPHDLIVKVAVASYCHTDGMVRAGVFDTGANKLPQTASHEGAGTVAAIGEAVSTLKIGDRVMCGLPLRPCGVCGACAGPDESHRQYCVNVEGHVGVMADGCLAEYVRVDERFTTRLPDGVSFLDAAPLAVSFFFSFFLSLSFCALFSGDFCLVWRWAMNMGFLGRAIKLAS